MLTALEEKFMILENQIQPFIWNPYQVVTNKIIMILLQIEWIKEIH